MHKRLETDLMSLAHSVLQMKNKEDVFALKEKSKEIYEKLSLLAFVEEYITTTTNLEVTKEDLVSKVEKALEVKDLKENLEVVEEVEKVVHQLEEEIIEQPFDELKEVMFSENETVIDDVVKVEEQKTLSLEEELQDTIPVDEIANLFDVPTNKSLNDKLASNIQIGLNDRITFVKNLFDGSQEDFNRVISQLNTYDSKKEAKKFINKMVKPDYDWSNQKELEARFIEIVERKFA